jgi:putative membrane protein
MMKMTVTAWTFLLTLATVGGAMADTLENRCPVVTENHYTNQLVVQTSQAALPRINSWGTRAFARVVIQERQQASSQIMALVQNNGITPIDSPIAQTLRQKTTDDSDSLSRLSGTDLERAYLDGQIALYEETLARMDQRWLMMATTPDLVAYLHSAKSAFTRYLDTARQIRGSLGTESPDEAVDEPFETFNGGR